MNDFFSAISSAISASQEAPNLNGREIFIRRAIVTNNDDPDNMRRIKVALASKGGRLESDWLQRIALSPSDDPPLPKRGQTVLVTFIDGNPHDGAWIGVVTNQPNQPLDKLDAKNDRSQEIEGESTVKTGKDYTIDCGKSIRLQNTAGAYVELNEAGFVIIGDAFGHSIVLGSGSSNNGCTWNLGGGTIQISDLSDFKIENKSVATVGAIDSRGDNLVNRGW